MGPGSELTLGRVFTEVQQNLEIVGITDYSITQPSLEQVFIRFAREQEERPEEPPPTDADAGAAARERPAAAEPSEPGQRTPFLSS